MQKAGDLSASNFSVVVCVVYGYSKSFYWASLRTLALYKVVESFSLTREYAA